MEKIFIFLCKIPGEKVEEYLRSLSTVQATNETTKNSEAWTPEKGFHTSLFICSAATGVTNLYHHPQ